MTSAGSKQPVFSLLQTKQLQTYSVNNLQNVWIFINVLAGLVYYNFSLQAIMSDVSKYRNPALYGVNTANSFN